MIRQTKTKVGKEEEEKIINQFNWIEKTNQFRLQLKLKKCKQFVYKPRVYGSRILLVFYELNRWQRCTVYIAQKESEFKAVLWSLL